MSGIIPLRKKNHLKICLNKKLSVDSGSAGLEKIQLYHNPLPESEPEDINLQTDFLGFRISIPLIILSMTGGSSKGYYLNRILAESAGEKRIPFSCGSIRVMIEHPEVKDHFLLKKYLRDVPYIANIGAAQISGITPDKILKAVTDIEADAIFVHLNAAQELFQKETGTRYSSWFNNISDLTASADKKNIPVLVKETGAGIPPYTALKLMETGVQYIDFSGSGGTDWVKIENIIHGNRAEKKHIKYFNSGKSFENWGHKTSDLLAAYRSVYDIEEKCQHKILTGKIIASGGLRTPKDFAAALACGSELAGAALPFLKAASEGGKNTVLQYVDEIEYGIKAAAVLSGNSSLRNFRKTEVYFDMDTLNTAENLVKETSKILSCS